MSSSLLHKVIAQDHPDILDRDVYFPNGLLGFPGCRHYKVERFEPGNGNDSPFYILQSLDLNLSFPLLHPNFLPFDYELTIDSATMAILGADRPESLDVLLIVTLRDRLEDITVNLQGPLVLNPASRIGLQVVIEKFPVRHPLLNSSF